MFPQLGSAPPEWAGDWEPSPETSPSYGASRAPGMRAAKADTEDTSMGPYGTSVGHGGRGAASDARGGALGALGRGGGAQAPVYTHWLNRGQGDNAAAGGSPARGGGLVQSVASVGDTDHDDVVTSRPQTQPSSRSNSRRNSLQRADTRPYNGGLPMPGQTDAAPGARGGGRPPLGSGRGRAADAPQSPQHDAIPVGAAQPPPAPAALARQSSSDNNNALSEQGLAGGGLGSSWGHDGDMDASRATGVGTGSIADPTAVRGRAPAAHQGPRRVLRVGRFDSWARMVAYEACWQVCLQSALSGERLAEPFLDRGCLLLKKAFGIEALVLGNPNQDRPEVIWEDVDTVQEALGTDEDYQRYTERVREGLRVEVLKIQRRQARGGGGDAGDPFVVLRPRSRPEDAAVVVRPGGSGGGGSSSVLVSQAEAAEDMLLELWDGAGCLARGAVPMGALWASLEGVEEVLAEVGGGAPGAAGAGGKEGGHCGAGAGGLGNALRHKAARLVRRAAGRKDPVVLGALRDGDGGARHKVHLLGESGVAVGKVTLALWRPTRAEADMANGRQAGRMCELGDGVGVGGGGNGGRADGGGAASALQRSWSLNNQQAYDMALMAALAAQGCGARKLVLEGPWQWLLKELARVYGVREAYTALTYLKWALQPQHATPTADCFSVLLAGVRPLKEAELARTLPAEESAMLRSICQAVESLVARALESYRMLSEQAPSGLCGPGEAPPQLPAPAMAPALALYSMLRDPLSPSDQQWLSARFQTAARRRYLKLELVCAEAPDSVAPAPHAPGGAQGAAAAAAGGGGNGRGTSAVGPRGADHAGGGQSGAEREYRQIEALCNAIRVDLEGDMRVQSARILPSFVNLPRIVAAEYCKELVEQLEAVLKYRPPAQPTPPAVRMLVSVGRLQAFLARNGMQPPRGAAGHVEARALFSPHVLKWLEGSQAAIAARCRDAQGSAAREATAGDAALAGHDLPAGAAAPSPGGGAQREARSAVVAEVVGAVNAEVAKYEQVVCHWPVFGCSLERVTCASMREVLQLVGSLYGGLPTAQRKKFSNKTNRKDAGGGFTPLFRGKQSERSNWEVPVDARGLPRLTLSEARVLNALKSLLHWVPEAERLLTDWCGGKAPGIQEDGAPGSGPRPRLGEQFAQLRKEVKMEYSAAVKNTVERMAAQLGTSRELNVRTVLVELARGGGAGEADVGRALGALTASLHEVLEHCRAVLAPRVHVSVVRGLWDCTCREVFGYAEALSDGRGNGAGGQGAWRGRTAAAAALDCIDQWFQGAVSRGGGRGLSQADLEPPFHADAARKLVGAAECGDGRDSYTVY